MPAVPAWVDGGGSAVLTQIESHLGPEVDAVVSLGLAGRLHPALRRLSSVAARAASDGPRDLERLEHEVLAVIDRQGSCCGGCQTRVRAFAVLARHQLRAELRGTELAALARSAAPGSITAVGADRRGGITAVRTLHHRPPPRSGSGTGTLASVGE